MCSDALVRNKLYYAEGLYTRFAYATACDRSDVDYLVATLVSKFQPNGVRRLAQK